MVERRYMDLQDVLLMCWRQYQTGSRMEELTGQWPWVVFKPVELPWETPND